MTKQDQNALKMTEPQNFDLQRFFPYLVRVFYTEVSGSVADVYGPMFGLSASEWRAMAVLGPFQSLSTSEIIARSSMDKVNVSRAIKGLRKAGLLRQDVDAEDKRRSVLRLTKEGRAAFHALVPNLLQVEKSMLAGLDEDEIETLTRLMVKVRKNIIAAKS